MDLHTRLLSSSERKEVYHLHMKQDFPKNELRPLRMIDSLVRSGTYYTFGIFEKEQLCAYAYV